MHFCPEFPQSSSSCPTRPVSHSHVLHEITIAKTMLCQDMRRSKTENLFSIKVQLQKSVRVVYFFPFDSSFFIFCNLLPLLHNVFLWRKMWQRALESSQKLMGVSRSMGTLLLPSSSVLAPFPAKILEINSFTGEKLCLPTSCRESAGDKCDT